MALNTEKLSIYIHWPFCLSKCPYCSFASIASPMNEALFEKFGEYLLKDLKRDIEKIDVKSIKSVFFGGGTPSLMSVKSIKNIMDFLYKNYHMDKNVEVSLEANPGTFDIQKMKNFLDVGINRLSLGIQSFSDKNLLFLGRSYDAKRSCASAEIVSNIFSNFSFDIIYGYKCQSQKSLENDLKKAVEFGCKHISCYQLTIEENTPFHTDYLYGKLETIDEAYEVKLYNRIDVLLKKYNIHRYEISNYAKPGYECQHNLCYWKYENYLGIGPGAHGRVLHNKVKIAVEKISDPYLWAKHIDNQDATNDNYHLLSKFEEFEEILIMGLRLRDGISMRELYNKVPKNLVDKFINNKKKIFLYQNGFTEKHDHTTDSLQLTEYGALKLDSVVKFILNL